MHYCVLYLEKLPMYAENYCKYEKKQYYDGDIWKLNSQF